MDLRIKLVSMYIEFACKCPVFVLHENFFLDADSLDPYLSRSTLENNNKQLLSGVKDAKC